MFAKTGKWLRRKLTLTLESWRHFANQGWTKLQELPWGELLLYGLMLTGLVLALQGCVGPSTLPTEAARNPQQPQLSEPLPQESYLQQAQKLIESWRNAVTGM